MKRIPPSEQEERLLCEHEHVHNKIIMSSWSWISCAKNEFLVIQ